MLACSLQFFLVYFGKVILSIHGSMESDFFYLRYKNNLQ